jgi:hypothetical protein
LIPASSETLLEVANRGRFVEARLALGMYEYGHLASHFKQVKLFLAPLRRGSVRDQSGSRLWPE